MEDAFDFSPKTKKHSQSSNGRKSGKSCEEQVFKFPIEQQRRQMNERGFEQKIGEHIAEEAKSRISIAQDLPLATEKAQSFKKTSVKVHKNSQNFHLHSEERAARRAGFNCLVANKINSFEVLRRFEEKILKVIEDEDIKLMRKEMVPKAQLMPLFDRPFLPKRSTRAPTVPREPKFCFVNKDCRIKQHSCSYFSENWKAIR